MPIANVLGFVFNYIGINGITAVKGIIHVSRLWREPYPLAASDWPNILSFIFLWMFNIDHKAG